MSFSRLVLFGIFSLLLGCPAPKGPTDVDVVDDNPPVDTEISEVEPEDSGEEEAPVEEPEDTEEPEEPEDTEEPDPITWTDCSGIPGDKACDFTFLDQNGDEWSLYDNYGTVMVIDFSTVWCGVCRNIAGDVQVHQDTYTDRGYDFLWVTVLVDGNSWGTGPTTDEIQDWVSSYGMTTSPVLQGDRTVIDTTAQDGYPITSWPTLVVVDETLTIHNGLLGWNEDTIFGWVDEVFGIVE